LATLLPFVEEAFLAQSLGMKWSSLSRSSSSLHHDGAVPLPLQAAPFGLDEVDSLLFDDASFFLAQSLGSSIFLFAVCNTDVSRTFYIFLFAVCNTNVSRTFYININVYFNIYSEILLIDKLCGIFVAT
jgi:hypothetical protein